MVHVFFDFDGVFNWHGTSRSAYRKNKDALGYVRKVDVYVPADNVTGGWSSAAPRGNWYTLDWSAELVKKLLDLRADYPFTWEWLTTWVGNTDKINKNLGITDTTTAFWVPDPVGMARMNDDALQNYRDTSKLAVVRAWVQDNPGVPFVWVDDTATKLWDTDFASAPHLVITPDEKYGMTKPDLDAFTSFVNSLEADA